MADFIQVPFKKDEEMRLFMLYLLDAVELSLDFVEFHDIVVQNGLVKSFDFCLLLPDLVQNGMISKTTKGPSHRFSQHLNLDNTYHQ